MWRQQPREVESKLPCLSLSMKTGSNNVEILRAIVARARVSLGCARSLKIQLRQMFSASRSQNVLTFNRYGSAAREPQAYVRAGVLLDAMTLCHTWDSLKKTE